MNVGLFSSSLVVACCAGFGIWFAVFLSGVFSVFGGGISVKSIILRCTLISFLFVVLNENFDFKNRMKQTQPPEAPSKTQNPESNLVGCLASQAIGLP